jgi:hypothetical protein
MTRAAVGAIKHPKYSMPGKPDRMLPAFRIFNPVQQNFEAMAY